MTNALQALLGAKPVSEIKEAVHIARLGVDFTVKALSSADIQALKEEATYVVKGKQTINQDKLGVLMIVKATLDPDFTNKDVLAHFGAKTAEQAIQSALLPGEFGALTEAVVKVSGLAPATAEEIEEVKN